jgi:hypothetical protein
MGIDPNRKSIQLRSGHSRSRFASLCARRSGIRNTSVKNALSDGMRVI